jgi:hypothetical protein
MDYVDGIEVETKREGSNAAVWFPVSIETELEFWRLAGESILSNCFIFRPHGEVLSTGTTSCSAGSRRRKSKK